MEEKTIRIIGNRCVQCHICEDVCPKGCISFHYNEKGFLVPSIDSKCIECGLCLSSCPTFKGNETKVSFEQPQTVFYGFSNNEEERLQSSSGGAFYALAKKAKQLGFDVISTVYSDDFKNCFYSSAAFTTIQKMRQSKYCESDFSGVVERVKANLQRNEKTLVCGTPCHINALRYKFGDNPNLFLIDFICHGVPSIKIYNDMLDFYGKKLKGGVVCVNFRYKKSKYSNSLVLAVSSNKRRLLVPWDEDRFYFGFEKYWILRDSCYFCDFKGEHSGDLTLGDFWNGVNLGIDVDNKAGCSLIFVNTDKGLGMLKGIADRFKLSELSPCDHYSIPHKNVNDYNKQVLFFELYSRKGFKYTCDHLFFKKQKFKTRIKKLLRLSGKK